MTRICRMCGQEFSPGRWDVLHDQHICRPCGDMDLGAVPDPYYAPEPYKVRETEPKEKKP